MTLSPDMRASQGALEIVSSMSVPDNEVDLDLIQETVKRVVRDIGPLATVVGLGNLVRLLLYLRTMETGIPSSETLEHLGLSIAEMDK